MIAFMFVIQVQNIVFGQSQTAHVNTKTLMDTLPSRKKALAEIQEVGKRSETELMELDTEFQKAYNNYDINKTSWDLQVGLYEKSRVEKLQQNFQKRQQELSNNIQNMTAAMNDNTYRIVQKAVKTIATKKGFLYVLEENSVLYAGGTDITNEVLTELLRVDVVESK